MAFMRAREKIKIRIFQLKTGNYPSIKSKLTKFVA